MRHIITLTSEEITEYFLHKAGIKVVASNNMKGKELTMKVEHHGSSFKIMELLSHDFNYALTKVSKNYYFKIYYK